MNNEALDCIPLAFKYTVTEGRGLVIGQLDGASAMIHEIAERERMT
jgi:hypothetical protein